MNVTIYQERTGKNASGYDTLSEKKFEDKYSVVQTQRADVPEIKYELVADYRLVIQLPLHLDAVSTVVHMSTQRVIIFTRSTAKRTKRTAA